MHRSKDESYYCRVCGLEQDVQPWGKDDQTPSFELCICCGIDVGYQDCTPLYAKKYREEWLKNGGKWMLSRKQPPNWSLEAQLDQIPEKYK